MSDDKIPRDNKDAIYLNGMSRKFLEDFYKLYAKVDAHMAQSDVDHKDLQSLKDKVANHSFILKTFGITLLAVVPTILGWLYLG